MRTPAILLTLLTLCLLTSSRVQADQPPRTIEVHAQRFAFQPAEITVKAGEPVHLRLFSDDVPHSLLIKGLGINQEVTKSHPVDVSFTPTQAGDFQGRCGRFCGGGHGRMTFVVHVSAH